jgi:hypothetical protein
VYRVLQEQTKAWKLKKQSMGWKVCDDMVSVQLIQNTNQKLDLVNRVMNHSGSKMVAEFFQ